MNEIIQEYGKMIAAVMAAVTLLALLFGKLGFWGVLGAGSKIEATDYSAYQDSRALQSVLEQELPQIEYQSPRIKKGESRSAGELFFAADALGNVLDVKVVEMLSPMGEQVAVNQQTILFSELGIYECVVSAVDTVGRYTEKNFKIPVIKG